MFKRVSVVLLMFLISTFGTVTLTSAQETTEMKVNVIGCVDPACENTVDVFTMDGASVTVYDSEGAVIDSCLVNSVADDFDGCLISMNAPAGSYEILPSADYADYTLLSTEPTEFTSEERGTTYIWYMVPPSEAPEEPVTEESKVNVIGCVDSTCENTVDIFTMDGATVSTYDVDGNTIDSCVISSEFDDFDGCMIVLPPSDGSVEIVPADEYATYLLLSLEPTVFTSDVHGTSYVWYFVPPADGATEESTEVPSESVNETPESGTDQSNPVTGLPATGSGLASMTSILSLSLVPLLMGTAAFVVRRTARS